MWFRIQLALLLAALSFPSEGRAEDADDLLTQAVKAANAGLHDDAIRLSTAAIEKDSKLAAAYYLRGRERFCSADIDESVKDFDRYVALAPDRSSRQWERGIALFYAQRYQDGAAQFALYQTYHSNDVENSVWRFLCMVPTDGVEAARKAILPIEQDSRVPMMEIYNLYAGHEKPEAVLAATRRGEPTPERLASRQFYAHLYLGLYYEVLGDRELARKYIELAADPSLADNGGLNRYMWDVARIHRQLRYDEPAAKADTDDATPKRRESQP